MKGLPTLVRLRKWELEERRRKLADLEALAGRLDEAIARLDDEVKMEARVASGDMDVSHAYSPYIAVTIDRRRTLVASAADVRQQIRLAHQEVTAAYQELKKFEIANANRKKRSRDELSRKEQTALDEMAIETFRRGG